MLTISVENYATARLSGNGKEKTIANNLLKKRPKGYRFAPTFKARVWDGYVSLLKEDYNSSDHFFPMGLCKQVYLHLKHHGIEVKLEIPKYLFNNLDAKLNDLDLGDFIFDKYLSESGFDKREYQNICVGKVLNKKRGLVVCSVGGGKSLIQYLTIRALVEKGEKVLVVVPTIMLVGQLKTDFEDYGWDADSNVSMLFGGERIDETKPVLISTYQSLINKDDEFFEQYTAFFVDEAHKSASRSIQEVSAKTINAVYRIGMTGTMPNEELDLLQIKGCFGEILHEIKTDELTEMGVLTPLQINVVKLQYPNHLCESARINKWNYQGEIGFIESIEERSEVISEIINNDIPQDENILLLCSKIAQIEALEKKLMKDTGFKVLKITGAIKPEEREKIRKYTNENKGVIIIATYSTFATGVNLKNLHHIMFGSPLRAKTSVVQAIGRVLRLHNSKSKAMLWDIVDVLRTKNKDGSYKYKWENHCMKQFLGTFKGNELTNEGRYQHYQEYGFKDYVYIDKNIEYELN